MRLSLTTFAYPGSVSGVNSWLLRILPLLSEKGWQIHVVVYANQPQRCDLLGALRDARLPFDVIDESRHRTTESRVTATFTLVKKRRPDVFFPNVSVPAYFAGAKLRRHRIPCVGIFHSDDPYYWALGETFFWGPIGTAVDAIVCVSSFLQERVAAQTIRTVEVSNICCGTPRPSSYASPDPERFRLIYLGRLEQEQKRIREVVTVMCRAAKELPGVEGVIFGCGSEREYVETYLNKHAAGLRVRYGGCLDPQKVLEELPHHHALLLLSDYEGTPVSVMEAMACGVVPICTNLRSGIHDLLKHEENGIVVEDRDQAVIDAVRYLAGNSDRWTAMSRAAAEQIEQNFSLEQTAERWSTLLQRVAKGGVQENSVQYYKKLPPVHPALAFNDPRRISKTDRCFRALRQIAKKIGIGL